MQSPEPEKGGEGSAVQLIDSLYLVNGPVHLVPSKDALQVIAAFLAT